MLSTKCVYKSDTFNIYIYIYKEDLALSNQQGLICYKTQLIQILKFNIYMYKEDLALDNLQWLIRHKTQPINPFFLIRILFRRIYLINGSDPKRYYQS